jgi:exodeoxyribonuclease V alpha subunit
VLRDVLASGRLPSARLETVFRQAAQSQIVTNAHRIRQGQNPVLAPPASLFQHLGKLPPGRRADVTPADCVFVPASPDRVAAVAAEWAAERLPRLLDVPPSEVQAIAPLVRVCQTLNSLLQAKLNGSRGQPERPHGALSLRVGDRVIQTHNNYQLGVFNGDTGTIVSMESNGGLTVDFGDGRVVAFGAADLLDLDHAYGLTVHRAQGSEWPGVVVLASSSFGPILSRNLLYTAITRARKAVVIVGDEAAVFGAVARTRDQERQTGLPVLLQAGEVKLLESASSKQAGESSPPTYRAAQISASPTSSSAGRGGSRSGADKSPKPETQHLKPADHDPDPYGDQYAPAFDDAPFEPMPDDWPDD